VILKFDSVRSRTVKITIEAINHVGLVVSDLRAAERFYVDILGLRPHPIRPSWLVLNGTSTLHLIPLADKSTADPPHHAYRHVALQVPDLRTVLGVLLTGGVRVLQVDFEGNQREVTSNDDPLDFGVGSLFVHDPDGNLIEFLQLGHGIFTPEMQSPASAVPL
jgi:catechol 2,3-dioxygenase-like lactoylglutathione lyase family enzyme